MEKIYYISAGKKSSKVKEAYFRNKTYGYHGSTMKLVFENGKEYYGSGRVDFMLKSYYSEMCSRPSCYNCKFKSKNRISDISIFDCWSFEKLTSNIDDNKGYTNILLNTEKSKKLLNEVVSNLQLYEIKSEEAIKYNGIMVENSAKPHENRENYYKTLNKIGLKKTVKKYIPITLKDKILEKMKRVLYKMKILKKIKKFKRRVFYGK